MPTYKYVILYEARHDVFSDGDYYEQRWMETNMTPDEFEEAYPNCRAVYFIDRDTVFLRFMK